MTQAGAAAADPENSRRGSSLLSHAACGPPEELFIYYLRGVADDTDLREGEDFLGNWLEGGCSFLFFKRPAHGAIQELLRHQPGLELIQEHRVPYIEWLGGEITAFREGRIRVVPVWEPPGADPDSVDVRLDPGVVFGAGNHPTTRGCLRELARIFATEPVNTVIDLGSGTGLLSLAAAKLGAGKLLGVDSNPLAVRTMRGNILRNGVQDRVLAACGRAESAALGKSDLVLANIHYHVMSEIAAGSDIVRAGRAVVAGLFPSQAEEIASVLCSRGMHVRVKEGLEEGWPILTARGVPGRTDRG